MSDVSVTDLGDVHKSVLMHADVNKGPEVDHIAHGACELHTLSEILNVHHILPQKYGRQLVTHITPGFEQF